jgi:hypothetical protein
MVRSLIGVALAMPLALSAGCDDGLTSGRGENAAASARPQTVLLMSNKELQTAWPRLILPPW